MWTFCFFAVAALAEHGGQTQSQGLQNIKNASKQKIKKFVKEQVGLMQECPPLQ
jgi:hypothetical protein